jgi:hypothetical protein
MSQIKEEFVCFLPQFSLTLILSFVLSDYTINLKRIKLKMYIKNSS